MPLARTKFLHTADLHLSRPFGFLPPQLADERRGDQRRVLTRIADLALEREVEILLVAGDMFDSADPDPTDLEAVTREFTRLGDAGTHVFVIPGNHDYIRPNSFWYRMSAPNLHIFLGTEWDTVVLDDLGIAVQGIAFQRGKSERRAFEDLAIPKNMPSIVMAHASYESFEGQLEKYHPFALNDINAIDASYVALGHYHKFNTISADKSRAIACYPGTPEGISFDSPEIGDRFVIVGAINDNGVAEIEPVKMNRRSMMNAQIDCTSFESQASLFDAMRRYCDMNTLMELRLTGMPTSEIAAVLEELTDRFKESFLYLSLDTSSLSIPSDLPADDRTIRGRFCKNLRQQIEDAADPERRRLLSRALELGLAVFSED